MQILNKRFEEALQAFRDGTGPNPGHRSQDLMPEDKDMGVMFKFCDEEYKAAVHAEPLGTVSAGCAWAVRRIGAHTEGASAVAGA